MSKGATSSGSGLLSLLCLIMHQPLVGYLLVQSIDGQYDKGVRSTFRLIRHRSFRVIPHCGISYLRISHLVCAFMAQEA